jgi:hypothetical protein
VLHVAAVLHPMGSVGVGSVQRTSCVTACTAEPSSERLVLIEHAMPRMPAYQYEPMLRTSLSAEGEIIRWCISRVDENTDTAIAEVVVLRPDEEGPRDGDQRVEAIPCD